MRLRAPESLKARIVAAAMVLFIAGLAGLTLSVAYLQRASMVHLVESQQLATATYVARDIDGKLRGRLAALETVALNMPAALLQESAAAHRELDQWLKDRRAIYTLFSNGLMVVRPNGNGAFSDYPPLPGRRTNSYLDRDWFIAARDSGKPAISQPLMARATNEPVVVMAVPVYSQRGTLLAVVAGVTRLAMPGFLDLVREIKLGQNGDFLVVARKTGLYVTGTDSSLSLKPVRDIWQSPMLDRYLRGEDGSGIALSGNGIKELCSGVSIPAADWFLVARLPASEALAPLHDSLKQTFLVAAIIIFIFGSLLWLLLARVLRPIGRATQDLQAMARGEQPLHALQSAHSDEIGHLFHSFNDLQTEIHRQNEEIQQQAFHDALTGLPNRLLLLDRMEHAIVRNHRDGGGLAVLFLDLDGFKPINDQLGHDTGDLVLQEIAARLQSLVRRSDTVARFGGDEFVILLPLVSEPNTPLAVAEKAIAALARPMTLAGHDPVQVGVSIGIALYPAAGATADALITSADAAMYQAKRDGGSRYSFAPT